MKQFNQRFLLGLVFSLFFIGANAQTTDRGGFKLSIGPEALLPLGDFKDFYDFGLGGSVRAEYPVLKDELFVSFSAGFNNYFAKDIRGLKTEDLGLIPIKAGLKYFPVSNFYVQADAGVSILTNKDDVGATKSATFVYAPQIGYQFPLGGKNYLDAGIKFEGNTKFTDRGKSNNVLGLRVAYAFGI